MDADIGPPRREDDGARRLLARMLEAGISRYEPDPLAALPQGQGRQRSNIAAGKFRTCAAHINANTYTLRPTVLLNDPRALTWRRPANYEGCSPKHRCSHSRSISRKPSAANRAVIDCPDR